MLKSGLIAASRILIGLRRELARTLALAVVSVIAACTPVSPTIINPDISLRPTIATTPTELATATRTEIPVPEGLNTVPEGYSAFQNPDGTWGYGEGTGAEIVPIPNLTVDATGARLRLDGNTITISTSEMKNRIKVGQAGDLQIYNSAKTGIDFAWNAEQKVWIKASDILAKDVDNPKRVQTRAELDALLSKEESVLTPFSTDTYFPPLDKIYTNYQTQNVALDSSNYNYHHPLGFLTEGELSKSPFRIKNFIILGKGEGRQYDTYIGTTKWYNPVDGTFSLLHYGVDDFEPGYASGAMKFFTDPKIILLPGGMNGFMKMMTGQASCNPSCNQLAFFKDNNYFDANWQTPEIKQMVKTWFETGRIQKPMEKLVLVPWITYITNYK